MRRLVMLVASAALMVAAAPSAVAAETAGTDAAKVHISFDSDLGAPCLFGQTHPLGDEYADLGVHFRGPADGEGGAILSDCAKFGVHARSGHEFLAFSAGSYALVPETISFDSPVSRVAMYVANGSRNESTYRLFALRDGQVVTRTTVVVKSAGYTGISVRAHLGIDAVVLRATTPDQAFVVDDLTFNPMS